MSYKGEIHISFTATLVKPDGSDTDGYGDECEPGQGYTIVQGWWHPNWTLWEVWDDPDPVHLDHRTSDLVDRIVGDACVAVGMDPDIYPTTVELLSNELDANIGAIDHLELRPFSLDVSAADEIRNHYTGVSVMPTAHVYAPTEVLTQLMEAIT